MPMPLLELPAILAALTLQPAGAPAKPAAQPSCAASQAGGIADCCVQIARWDGETPRILDHAVSAQPFLADERTTSHVDQR